MAEHDSFAKHLRDTHELEEFCHRFIGHLTGLDLKDGEDVTRYAAERGLEVPALLRGSSITWESPAKIEARAAAGGSQRLTLTRPRNSKALLPTSGGIRVGEIIIILICAGDSCILIIIFRS